MKTRLWPIIIAIALAIILLPAPAKAEEPVTAGDFTLAYTEGSIDTPKENTDYTYADGVLTITTTTPLTIAMADGVSTTSNRIVIGLSEGDPADITLAGVNITAPDERHALSSEQASVVLTLAESSTNNLTGGDSDSASTAPGYGIGVSANLTIKGNGYLTAIGGNRKYDIGYFGHGIYCEGALTIADRANVTAQGGHSEVGKGGSGIYCQAGPLTISNSTVTVTGGICEGQQDSSGGTGICCEYGSIDITGSIVTATGGAGGSGGGTGIFCYEDLNIYESSIVKATGGDGSLYGDSGISCYDGLDIDGNSIVKATGGEGGETGSHGIYCYQDELSIQSGTIEATGGNGGETGGQAIYCSQANLSISGGTVTATGGNGTTGTGGSGIYSNYIIGTLNFGSEAVVTAAAGKSDTSQAASVAAIYYWQDYASLTNNGLLFTKDSNAEGFIAKLPENATVTPSNNFTVPDCELIIPANTTLTVGEGVTMINEGAIDVKGILNVQGTITGTGSITPDEKKLTASISDVRVKEITYDGQAITANDLAYTYTGDTNEPTITITWHSDSPATEANKIAASAAAGTYYVKVSAEATNLYQATTAERRFTISKAPQTTAPATPQAASVSTASITVTALPANANGAAVEYSIDGGQTWQPDTVFNNLTPNTAYHIIARYGATDNYDPSDESPALKVTTTAESPETPVIPSIPSTPSEPEPDGPTTDGSAGWSDIQTELEAAHEGDTITVEMNGTTEVPSEIFAAIAGQDITVSFEMDNGVSWQVNGTDIPQGTSLGDLDLGVGMNTTGISANVINAITGAVSTVQITLSHDGEFGFTMTLSAPLGDEHHGYWANLYYFDEGAQRLIYQTASLIDETGHAHMRMSHASQYAIVIDDYDHGGLPFTDVSASDWYYDAVAYVFAGGIMTGTSDTTFAPQTATTRAMIVSMLHRLEGGASAGGTQVATGPKRELRSPSASTSDFTDVAAGSWYADPVSWAACVGIAGGYEDNTFQPNRTITREELASILYRYAEYKGYDVSARADLSAYTDAPSPWAADVMAWANAQGLITGRTATTIDAQSTLTRAECAAIFQRFIG